MTPRRIKILLYLAAIVPLGFGLKFYHGHGDLWCNAYGAAVLYEVFWCLVAFFIFPVRGSIPLIASSVLLATCTLETLQLWHQPFLEAVRGTRPGVWLIGNGFDWLDFPHYVFGCALGWLCMRIIDKK